VKRLQTIEYYALLIIATMGFSLMGASADLIMLYIALEMASISSYVLAGFVKENDRSSEAGHEILCLWGVCHGLDALWHEPALRADGANQPVCDWQYGDAGTVCGYCCGRSHHVAEIQNLNGVLLLAAA
jgi:hypothetical protein